MCRRMRAGGARILHIDAPMTGHDIAILRLSQYWRRAVRTGFAYAEISERYRHTPDPLWARESRANLLRGSLMFRSVSEPAWLLPFCGPWVPLIVLALGGSALAVRTAVSSEMERRSLEDFALFGFHSHLQHVPILQGQILYFWGRRRGQRRGLIEYKSS